MADPFQLMLTAAGLDALVDAQSGTTEAITIVEMGLTEQAFTMAPTLTALPGEFKRIASVSGQSVSETVIHMTAQDPSTDFYDLRGIGLYLSDGTLFAVYGQADPIFSKVSVATFLSAFDVAFAADVSSAITFGNAAFLYPPATESERGVAKIATQALTDAGTDDATMVTPKKLAARLVTFATRSITGGGLVTGGGDLSVDRELTVTAASGAEIAVGAEAGKAVTPAAIAAVPQTFGAAGNLIGLGGSIIKHGTVTVGWPGGGSVTFPVAFPNACDRVLLTPMGNPDGGDEADEPWWVTGVAPSGFSVSSAGDGTTTTFGWVAFGH